MDAPLDIILNSRYYIPRQKKNSYNEMNQFCKFSVQLCVSLKK